MTVTLRVLVKVILVIFLGGVEVGEWLYLHLQRLVVLALQLGHCTFDDWQVGGISVVDACTILRAMVMALPIETRRVYRLEI